MSTPPEYWNHNTAFHPWILRRAKRSGGRTLDVGCGDGLLVQRLSPVVREVVGIDPDAAVIARARERLDRYRQSQMRDSPSDTGVELRSPSTQQMLVGDVLTDDRLTPGSFDTVTCVSTLHHLPTEPALARLKALLAPGGTLLVVGLTENHSARDWALDIAVLLPVKIIGRLRHEQRDIGVEVRRPQQTFAELRTSVRSELPGARLRRRFYYRYSLEWTKPG